MTEYRSSGGVVLEYPSPPPRLPNGPARCDEICRKVCEVAESRVNAQQLGERYVDGIGDVVGRAGRKTQPLLSQCSTILTGRSPVSTCAIVDTA
jgi:hypothetical protein